MDSLHNSLVAISQFLYTIFIVFVTNALVKKGVLSQEMSRKIVHIWAGGMVLFWPLYRGHWAPYFFCITPGLWVFILVYTALTKGPDDPSVRSMTRTGNPKDLLKGVLFFPLMTIALTLAFWRGGSVSADQFPALAGIAAVGFGDGIAPITSRLESPGFGILGSRKSLTGSLGMFLGTLVSIAALSPLILDYWPGVTKLLIVSAVATLVEALSPPEVDNLLVAAATAAVAAL